MDVRKRDMDLIKRAKKGDQAAFSRLMELYYDSLHASLNQKMNNSAYVDDVAIQTFNKAFRKLELYNPNFAFSTWLYRIGYNQMIDHFRKFKKHKTTQSLDFELNGEQGSYDPATSQPDPEEALIRKQTKESVNQLIQQLPSDYRDIIKLRFLDELSYQEIMDEMNIPLGTVKAKLFRARKLLLRIFTLSNLKR